jgi:signal transduction histidine kinase
MSASYSSIQQTPQAAYARFKETHPAHVWIIDDDTLVTQSLMTLFELETSHVITAFNNPKKALDALENILGERAEIPEVIISDFLMPGGMDGISFLSQVRQKLPDTTCILLTGYADKENAIAAINQVGLYRYIEKPWDNSTLLLTLKTGIEHARLTAQLRNTIEDLTEAKQELFNTNKHLEHVVALRTRQWHAAFSELQTIITQTVDAIITLDAQWQIVTLNPSARTLLAQAFGRSELSDWQSASCAHAFESAVLGEVCEGQLGCVPVEYTVSMFEAESAPDTAVNGASPYHQAKYIVVLRDIARRKEAERLRDDFVATLTHDLRTPLLATIQTLGFLTDGLMGPLSEKQMPVLAMMKDSHESLLSLVNTLLDVYRYESGKQRLIFDTVDVFALIKRVLDTLHSLAEAKSQNLTLSCASQESSSCWNVLADSSEIRRVLTNLIGNAIKFTPEKGQIKVHIATDKHRVLVSVMDNGPGIPPEDVSTLFERFAQGTRLHRVSGSGLGLFLSQQIAKAHGGQILIDSTVGSGSTFTLILPQ